MKKWWHDKVAYQIYPKSFYDSNGDGIGDLQGIISKLDYLENLGVDILWLSPIFCSPLADQGYDISDYYNIDPRFGTMEDMEELIAKAKERNMYILMDLVVNHCSDEHDWFQKAIQDPSGKYGNYFYIVDARDGKAPTNWRSYFGGSVWDKLPGWEDKYYMHLFHKKQPDLNWENGEVREEVYKMVNWWLDKGLGGFRIDAIINIKKSFPFRDYPIDRDDGLSKIQNMLDEAKGIGIFLKELRDRTFAPHDAFTVGEVFDINEDEIPQFIGNDGHFSTMFDFNTTVIGDHQNGWYDRSDVTAKEYIEAVCRSQSRVKNIGFLSNIIENHDEPRGVSRYLPADGCHDMGKKMLALLTFLLRGVPFIYQGQEIGMENMEFTSIDQIDDISTLDEYKVALHAGLSEKEALRAVNKYSRDNARTPMQWNAEENAGFTTGTPWLVVNPKYERINVESQLAKDDSVYEFYRKLIALRKNPEWKDILVYGDFISRAEPDRNLMAYLRQGMKGTIFVAANYQIQPQEVDVPGKIASILLSNDDCVDSKDGKIHLKGYQAVAIEVIV
ncbi:glycoside hydrolase family 13 protein [Kineothrix sp. MB12-C1]|uniref:glycoside hydrolase family 13 protein n=1 Tax=Kineothrix sp. MB12-C1 TaxID=3070215 RepID=UPI0027D2E94E|nr:alpha-glucosidase [Kineothrix sp. MB12-C1]WMC92611.1 alpha-glucosidase [Kineothrix sp. MB12-C1]